MEAHNTAIFRFVVVNFYFVHRLSSWTQDGSTKPTPFCRSSVTVRPFAFVVIPVLRLCRIGVALRTQTFRDRNLSCQVCHSQEKFGNHWFNEIMHTWQSPAPPRKSLRYPQKIEILAKAWDTRKSLRYPRKLEIPSKAWDTRKLTEKQPRSYFSSRLRISP